MHYVKPITVGPAGHTPVDPERRDRIPAGMYRPIQANAYWRRLAADGDVELRDEDGPKGPPAEAEIEGYEAPVAAEAAMAVATFEVPISEEPARRRAFAKPASEGSDAA